jgi:Putative Actinobacterial Holin-X, holin superfamily III
MDQGNGNHSLSSLIASLTREVSNLIRQEVALARAEVSEKVGQIETGVASLAGGGGIMLVGLFFLAEALVFGVAALLQLWTSAVIAAWLAPLLVGLVIVIVGWVLLAKGRRNLKARNLAPRRTAESLRRDEQLVEEHVR